MFFQLQRSKYFYLISGFLHRHFYRTDIIINLFNDRKGYRNHSACCFYNTGICLVRQIRKKKIHRTLRIKRSHPPFVSSVCNWFGAGSPNLAKPDSDSSIQSYENIYDRNWLLKGNCMIMPGVERVDTIRTADGWTMKSVWCRDDLSDTSMMKLSTATGYIYGFVQDVDSGIWQYIVLDFDTGKTVLTVDVASLYGYNNMAIGMYAGRDGNKLYCPTGYKELLRLQDRFVFLPEMPYRKVDLDKTSRRVLSAAEFQAAGGAGTPASWLHTATLDNLHPATTVSFRINGLTGNAADYKLFALGTDGRYHEVSDWHFDDAPARLSAKKVYTICLTVQDGGSFDLSPDAKEVTLSVVLAR